LFSKPNPKKNKFHFFNQIYLCIYKGYNIIGDGTPAALIPIFTGQTEEELPNVLKINPKAKYVDEAYPFIWKELHKNQGYMSIYLDDWPQMSAFSYRMKGFLNHTCHHYFRHYQLKLWDYFHDDNDERNIQIKNGINNDYCIGARKRHKVLIDLLLDFKKEYNKQTNNIAIMHYVENSHDTNERFNWIDNDLFYFFNNNQDLFENTAIFLYSDHGLRFNDKRESSNNNNNRYLEERLPFFSIYLPNEYKLNNPIKFNNFKQNLNLLTSPFDIHATIRDLTCLPKLKSLRSQSLFDKINPARSCDHIGISQHFCVCKQNWIKLNISNNNNNKMVLKASLFIVDSINKIISKAKHLCTELKLKEIISAETVNKNDVTLMKIQLITIPNEGIYESVLSLNYDIHTEAAAKAYEFKSNEFSIKSKNDISRIDSYGEQPECVVNTQYTNNPDEILDLRKFCLCNDLVSDGKLKINKI